MTQCLCCHAADVELFLDLGATALANKFTLPGEVTDTPEPSFPLRVGSCRVCGHVQLMDLVPPSAMFEDYLYISSLSSTLVNHLDHLAATVVQWRGLKGDDLVVDIGCNDGTLLSAFRRRGLPVLGVDPARNLAPLAAEKGVDVKTAFFGEQAAREILASRGPARAITMTNAFPHIPNLEDLLTGVRLLLADDGVFVIEAHYLLDMLEQCAFDTIYHEHVSYWALGPMMALFNRLGLKVVRAERLPIHHGQLRVFVQRANVAKLDETVTAILAGEQAAGIPGMAPCQAFAEAAHRIRHDLRAFIATAKAEGKTVAGYGAPAKGSTLLSFLGLGPDDIKWIADRSPLKHGRLTPGTHIPVVPTGHILEEMPDYLLLLAWNFAEEILAQQDEYRRRGGRFVLPVPEVKIL